MQEGTLCLLIYSLVGWFVFSFVRLAGWLAGCSENFVYTTVIQCLSFQQVALFFILVQIVSWSVAPKRKLFHFLYELVGSGHA